MSQDEKNLELKVGVFVFIGIIMLFIIVFSIGKIYLFEPGYKIRVLFNFAGGLGDASPVRLAGVNVGEVNDIRIFYDESIMRTRVEVVAWIKKNIAVEKNSIARINTLGLLGEKYLEIMPGSQDSGIVEENGILIGEDPIVMDELAEDLKDLADSAGVVMSRLDRGEGTIGKLLTEDGLYNEVEAFVKDIRAHPWKLFMKGKEQ